MTTQLRNDTEAITAEQRREIAGYLAPTQRLPIQQEIQKLMKNLHDFNEQITELEKVGHPDRAMEELRANAIDFARQIDELRCVLGQVRGE